MQTLQIENLTKEEFVELLQEAVKVEIEKNQPEDPSGQEYLSRKQTAKMLGISLPTLHEWTMEGRIQAYRIGRLVRYKRADVHAALKSVNCVKHQRR
jgi:excisionase family DNA binding protein